MAAAPAPRLCSPSQVKAICRAASGRRPFTAVVTGAVDSQARAAAASVMVNRSKRAASRCP